MSVSSEWLLPPLLLPVSNLVGWRGRGEGGGGKGRGVREGRRANEVKCLSTCACTSINMYTCTSIVLAMYCKSSTNIVQHSPACNQGI